VLQILKFFDADPDPGYRNFLTLAPDGNSDPESGINILDPQHWKKRKKHRKFDVS
jgi:hypothetical protein